MNTSLLKSQFFKQFYNCFDTKGASKYTEAGDVISDGYIMYRGNLGVELKALCSTKKGYFEYQTPLPKKVVDDLFERDTSEKVKLEYLYTLILNKIESDIYRVISLEKGNNTISYIRFNKIYRKFLLDTPYVYKVNKDRNPDSSIYSGIYVATDFGELIIMPMKMDEVLLPHKL